MKQIYDQVDDKALFEQVRDDIRDGVIQIRGIDELGVVCRHDADPASFDLYVVIDGREQGPYKEEKVVDLLKRGDITGQTYAWSEGMQDWQRAHRIGNFSAYC